MLDAGVLPIDLDVIRVTLHLLAATIWVGGQILLAALVGPLRRAAPEAVTAVARAFARVGWPAFAVLIVTGLWTLSAGGLRGDEYQNTLIVKLVLVALSGMGASLHTVVKRPALRGIWGAVGLLGAMGALLLGVSMG